MKRGRYWFLTTLVLLAAGSRLVPHPPNVTPLAAVALFGAATFERRWLAFLTPLAALLLSDLLLQLTYAAGWQSHWGFYQGQWVIYTCFLITASLGFLLRRRRDVFSVLAVTAAGSLIFFIATNFAFWASGLSYPRTAQGLLICYESALPFLRNSLIGDLAYSLSLFGTLALAEARIPVLRQAVARLGDAA